MLIQYTEHNFRQETLVKIMRANQIIEEYQADGVQITLRQLYYQFVARDIIKNNQKEYDKLQRCITHARRAGLVDWSAIIDRTRNLTLWQSWGSPADTVRSAAWSYNEDLWKNQKYFPIVMVEKDAAIGTVERVCSELRVPFMSNRGYTSDAELHSQALRLERLQAEGKTPIIIYCGDFDPSGWDMTRDIDERFELFMGGVQQERIVLNPEQIAVYNPPPNFVKLTDSRAQTFMAEHKTKDCYELDAVSPSEVVRMVKETVLKYRDEDTWQADLQVESERREQLKDLSMNWDSVVKFLQSEKGKLSPFTMTWAQLCDFFTYQFSCDGKCVSAGNGSHFSLSDCRHQLDYLCRGCGVSNSISGATLRIRLLEENNREQPRCIHCNYNRAEKH